MSGSIGSRARHQTLMRRNNARKPVCPSCPNTRKYAAFVVSTLHIWKHSKRTDVLVTAHNSEWLTASEAALHLKVAPRTLVRWARRGSIPAHRLSGTGRITWRFLRSEL